MFIKFRFLIPKTIVKLYNTYLNTFKLVKIVLCNQIFFSNVCGLIIIIFYTSFLHVQTLFYLVYFQIYKKNNL